MISLVIIIVLALMAALVIFKVRYFELGKHYSPVKGLPLVAGVALGLMYLLDYYYAPEHRVNVIVAIIIFIVLEGILCIKKK